MEMADTSIEIIDTVVEMTHAVIGIIPATMGIVATVTLNVQIYGRDETISPIKEQLPTNSFEDPKNFKDHMY
jgi:hypothetical protein